MSQEAFRTRHSSVAWRAVPFLCVAVLVLCGRVAAAQVPFVPTPLDVVERMLTVAKVRAGDYLIDLGSGDGRIVRMAATKFGARGFGVELNADLVQTSTDLARKERVADRATFMQRDLFETDLSDATVLTMYLLPAVNERLRPRLLQTLRPGTRIVSHDFDMGDWPPDETVRMYSPDKYMGSGGDSTIHLWIVPADVAGRWQWRMRIAGETLAFELDASQKYQRVEGSVRIGSREARLENLRLAGEILRFELATDVKGQPARLAFVGKVSGNAIEGSATLSGPRLQGALEWSAARTARQVPPEEPRPGTRG